MAQLQDQKPYSDMSVVKELRPMLHRAGFKNINRFNGKKLAQICEEFDKTNEVRIRDLPHDYQPSEAMGQVRNAIIASILGEQGSNSTSTATVQSSSGTNNKRKQTQTAGSQRSKRQKASNGNSNDRVGSDAEGQNGDTGARHGAGQGKVSETDGQASNQGETQATNKADEKRERSSKAPKKPAAPKTVKNSASSKVSKRSVAPKTTRQPVASSTKQSQEPTRKSSRIKNKMNTVRTPHEEPRNLQAGMSKPTVPRAKDTATPAANPSSAAEKSKPRVESKEPKGSSDNSGDNGKDSEEDSDDSDEEQRAGRTDGAPAQRTPHNFHLGTHRLVRYEVQWDPLDERIPTSSLAWYEQVERQRARQAQSEGEPKTTKK